MGSKLIYQLFSACFRKWCPPQTPRAFARDLERELKGTGAVHEKAFQYW
jgi:hypothetical protein